MSGAIRSHRELLIWQKGIELVDVVDSLVGRFPPAELSMLTDQMVRAARSVPTNIAEGHGRYTPAELARFLTIAHGSLSELDTHLEIARRRSYLDQRAWGEINERVAELGRMIRAFRAALRRR
jgi:four helix bundle protein